MNKIKYLNLITIIKYMVKAKDLIKAQIKKDKQKVKTYEKIYEFIEKKIILASSGNNYELIYQVPQYILGLPLYSMSICIDYICKRLKENEFKVKYYEPNVIHIIWKVE